MYLNQVFTNLINIDDVDTYTSNFDANRTTKFDEQKLIIKNNNIHSNLYAFTNDASINKILFTNKFNYYKNERVKNNKLRYLPYFSIGEMSTYPILDDETVICINLGSLYLRYLYMIDEEMLKDLKKIFNTICVNDSCITVARYKASQIIFNKVDPPENCKFVQASKLLTLHENFKYIYKFNLFYPVGEYFDDFTVWSTELIRFENLVYDTTNVQHNLFMNELLNFYNNAITKRVKNGRFEIISFDRKETYFKTDELYKKSLEIIENFDKDYFEMCNNLDDVNDVIKNI